MQLPKFPPKFLISLVVALVVVAAAVPAIYFYRQYRLAQQRLSNPTEFAKEEAKSLVARVGKLIDLPTDEEPTIATVSDVAKLANQPFFAKAKNGDKVLIYTNAKKAILYNPELNKILNVAPVNIGTPSANTEPTSSTSSGQTP